jgi:hypothetical protein
MSAARTTSSSSNERATSGARSSGIQRRDCRRPKRYFVIEALRWIPKLRCSPPAARSLRMTLWSNHPRPLQHQRRSLHLVIPSPPAPARHPVAADRRSADPADGTHDKLQQAVRRGDVRCCNVRNNARTDTADACRGSRPVVLSHDRVPRRRDDVRCD